jgi:uncharacterized RDD family membrane protein YckC
MSGSRFDISADKLKKVLQDDPIAVMGVLDNNKQGKPVYAGLFLRLLARVLDYFFIILVSVVLVTLSLTIYSILNPQFITKYDDPAIIYECNDLIERNVNPQEYTQVCKEVYDTAAFTARILIVTNTILLCLYHVLMPLMAWRGTLFKKLFKLQIVEGKGKNITLLQSLTREIFFIILYLSIALIMILPENANVVNTARFAFNIITSVLLISSYTVQFNERRRTLSDLLADTYVIGYKK